jgi:excisionase family DNA binding protein
LEVCDTVETLEISDRRDMVGDSDKEWLTVKQAADRLGVSTQTARNYADSGRLGRVARLPGGHRRIASTAVEQLRREIRGEPSES